MGHGIRLRARNKMPLCCGWLRRSSQFSRYLLETAGSFDQDTNARASVAKLNKNRYSRAFVAL
jgi:hypothetical protein